MKGYNKLEYLSLGSITPRGFLREQMERNKNGLGGHLDELEPGMIRDPFVARTYVKAWVDGNQEGWGAEISGNYHTGLMGLAFSLKDKELIAKAERWAKAFLARQREDGYLGTYGEEGSNIFDDYNAWGTACGMRALLLYYEATGKKEVFDAVYRCMLWFCDKWKGEKKTLYAGIYITEVMVRCYMETKDHRLIDFCKEYYDFLDKKAIFFNSLNKYLSGKMPYNSHHTAGLCSQVQLPALLYMATGEKRYLDASLKVVETLRARCMQLSGGAVCNTEYLAPPGAVNETEYCAFTFLNAAYSAIEMVTGDARFGDYMEEIFYNGAQGARKKDEKAIAYMSAPNQIYATERSSPIFSDMQVYAPCYPTSCCPVNSVLILPDFVRSLAYKDACKEDELYFTAYGPCEIKTDLYEITEDTAYPFGNSVRFIFGKDAELTLNLKLPEWQKGYSLSVNGRDTEVKTENGYIVIRRTWRCGDVLSVAFTREISIHRIDDTDGASKYPLAFKYGALLFSLPIPENWVKIPGRPMTPLPDGWSWYDVEPLVVDDPYIDSHDVLGYRKEIISWNVSVCEKVDVSKIEITEKSIDGYPWENPPITLTVPMYKSPDAFPPYLSKNVEPYCARQAVTHPVICKLVPYGCTNLRITYFPIADV